MPSPKSAKIALSPRLERLLEHMARQTTSEYCLVFRARMILAIAGGLSNRRLAQQEQIDRDTVRRWRERWREHEPRLDEAEAAQMSDEELLLVLRQVLSDAPRSGAPPVFTAEQIVHLVAVACESPDESGRPISHWTPSELADEVRKRRIVETISPSSVQRFLKSGGSQAASRRVLA